MADDNHHAPALGTLAGRLAQTGWGALHNRVELFAVEWHEERLRLTELMLWGSALTFLAVMAAILITTTVIFLFPADYRIYVAAAFALIYVAGVVVAWLGLRALLKREPFAETVAQLRKDKLWFESFQ